MTTPTARVLAAIDACCAASPAPPTSGDIAAAVIRSAAAELQPDWSGAQCADYLAGLAAALDTTLRESAAP